MASFASPLSLMHSFGHVYRNWTLVWELAKREITDRYVGQILGTLWTICHPLVLAGVYVFLFRVVFKSQMGGTEDLPLDYTTYIFAGLFPWITFQESMAKGTTTMLSHAGLVKQVAFPIEVLPVKAALSSMVSQLVGTLTLIVYVLCTFGYLPWTYALLPILWCGQLLAMAGVVFMLSAIGAYFRDIKDFVQIFCVVGMYLMPVFYHPIQVPEIVRPVLYLNPLSYMGWCYQDVCFYGRFEHPWSWVIFLSGSVLTYHLGFRVFTKLKVSFGSVL